MNQPPLFKHLTPDIASITLQRPDIANAITPDDLILMENYVETLSAKVLILKSTGKHFSAGFDLKSLKAGEENRFGIFAQKLADLPLLTLASLQGAVVGGSTDLALACDIIIGSDKASMMMPAAKLGVTLYDGALQRYVARLGLSTAKRLIFLGERIEATEMKRITFLTELVPHETLETRTLEIAHYLANLPHHSAIAMKRGLANFANLS